MSSQLLPFGFRTGFLCLLVLFGSPELAAMSNAAGTSVAFPDEMATLTGGLFPQQRLHAKKVAKAKKRRKRRHSKNHSSAKKPPVAEEAASKPQIAILPVQVKGLQPNDQKLLDAALRAEATAAGRYFVLEADQTAELVETMQSVGLDCDISNIACGLEVGQISATPFVLLSAAVVVDEEVGWDLRLIDIEAGKEIRRAVGMISKEPSGLVDASAVITRALFAEQRLGVLSVTTAPAGAKVSVDGVPRGEAPLPHLDGLVPGVHLVSIEKEGFDSVTERVEVKDAETLSLDTALHQKAAPVGAIEEQSGEGWLGWSTAALGTLFVAGGATAAVAGYLPWRQYQAAVHENEALDTSSASYLNDAERTFQDAQKGSESWTRWGRLSMVTGVSVMAVGAVAMVGGAVAAVLMSGGPAPAGVSE